MSVARFLLVAECQQQDGVGGRVKSIEGEKARVTEREDQLTQVWIVGRGASDLGRCLEQGKMLADCRSGTSGSSGVLGVEDFTAAFEPQTGSR